MAKVFFFQEPNQSIPDWSKLQSWVSHVYPVVVAGSWEDLQVQLAAESPTGSVVVFSAPLSSVNVWVGKFKEQLPTLASVVVLPESEMTTCPPLLCDADFLLTPFSEFEALSRVSAAVRMAELRATLETTSQLDEVSLLSNYRYYIARLNSEIAMAKRYQSTLTCAVLSLDFFQMYVDCYGYEFVVNLLRHVAMTIRKEVRQEDVVARVGDHEIGLLLPRSVDEGAQVLMERIVSVLTKLPYAAKTDDQQLIEEELSLHVGIASFPVPDDSGSTDADVLLRYARHALHQAKMSGNQPVQCFNQIQPSVLEA